MNKKIMGLPIIIPGMCLLFGCANNVNQAGLLYSPAAIEKSASVSSRSREIYSNFTDIAASNFFKMYEESNESICISLPDLFLCYNMMAILSEDSLQEAYLGELRATSMDELITASKELIPVFCYVSNDGYSDSGAFNLNGLFFDPDLDLKDNADNCFKTIAEAFNGYVFKSKPNTELVDSWIREADKEGYLSEVPTPYIDPYTILSTISCYSIFDAFDKDKASYYESQYESGEHKLDYTLTDGSKKSVDYICFFDKNSSIEIGKDYVAANGRIDTCSIKAYRPNDGVSLSKLSESIFSEEEKEYEYFDYLYMNTPMFEVDSKIEGAPSDLLPSFSDGVGTGFFNKKENTEYGAYLAQNNKLRFDYKGFKGASITVMGTTETAAPEEPTSYTLNLDRPFIFEVDRQGLPLYFGKINDPNYPSYQ